VLELRVPSLRERSMDIPLLIPALMAELGYAPRVWSDEAVSALIKARLPGNVRQLRNIIERALVNAPPTGPIKVEHLGLEPAQAPELEPGSGDSATSVSIVDRELKEIVRRAVSNVYELCKRNLAATARQLGIDVKTVRRSLEGAGED
jgi:DNA-binding NtrC family response regulator